MRFILRLLLVGFNQCSSTLWVLFLVISHMSVQVIVMCSIERLGVTLPSILGKGFGVISSERSGSSNMFNYFGGYCSSKYLRFIDHIQTVG